MSAPARASDRSWKKKPSSLRLLASRPPTLVTPPAPPPAPAPRYPLDEKRLTAIDNCFSYHPVKDGQVERYALIRAKARELALTIVQSTPASREQSSALTRLEETVMHANASIARNE